MACDYVIVAGTIAGPVAPTALRDAPFQREEQDGRKRRTPQFLDLGIRIG